MSSQENKVILKILFYSTIALAFSYAVKIIMLQVSMYKYTELALLFLSFVLLLFSRLRILSLLVLSMIILFFEITANIKVPFIIHLSEAAIKIASPIIFFQFLSNYNLPKIITKGSILLTFTAHGLLAMNIIQTPETFYLMVQKILLLEHEHSKYFLLAAGVIDIISSLIIISLSNKNRLLNLAIWYCIIWGFITAFARTLYVYDFMPSEIIITFITETIIRLPNSLIPLVLILYVNENSKNSEKSL